MKVFLLTPFHWSFRDLSDKESGTNDGGGNVPISAENNDKLLIFNYYKLIYN